MPQILFGMGVDCNITEFWKSRCGNAPLTSAPPSNFRQPQDRDGSVIIALGSSASVPFVAEGLIQTS